MKTKQIISILTTLILVLLYSCDKEITPLADSSLELRAKGGNGKPDNGPEAITILDLGTLGGDYGKANGINIVDGIIHIVGTSEAANGDRHAFLWTEADGMTDLGYLHEEKPYSRATDINANGTIAGYSASLVPPYYSSNAVTWSALNPSAGPLSINPTSSVNSSAEAINIHGDIVGSRVDTCGYEGYGACGPGSPGDSISIWSAFMWKSDGGMVDLGTLGGTSRGTGINNSGIVTGYSEHQNPEPGLYRAFIWQEGGFQILNGLEESYSWPFDINNSGQIVGEYNADPGCQRCKIRGFLWEEGSIVELPTLGTFTTAFAITDNGYVTGVSKKSKRGGKQTDPHCFLWKDDIGMIDLGTLKGGNISEGYDIIEHNNLVLVVGISETKDKWHAVLWSIDPSLL